MLAAIIRFAFPAKHCINLHNVYSVQCIVKGSLDEKLPIYEQDPKSKRLDSFEKRFVRD